MEACYEFGNDSMKMCSKHKIRMKVDHIIKNQNCAIYIYIILMKPFFIMNCLCLGMNKASDVQFIMYTLCESSN